MQNHAQDAKGRGRPPKQRGDKLLTKCWVGTEVLTEKGYSAVGVDEILQRTGTRCSFYYYFKTKGRVRRFKPLHYFKTKDRPSLWRLRSSAWTIADRLPFRLSGRKAGAGGQHVAGKLPASSSAVFAEWQDVFARGLKRAQETGEISPELDCASTAAFFWYGWEGALQRANLELNIKPVDIFIGNFFFPADGISLTSP